MSNKKIDEKKPVNPELFWFGFYPNTGRPILERVDTNRCKKCKGFGSYGNPLCGAVYTCNRCNGTGHNPKFMERPLIKKIVSFFK